MLPSEEDAPVSPLRRIQLVERLEASLHDDSETLEQEYDPTSDEETGKTDNHRGRNAPLPPILHDLLKNARKRYQQVPRRCKYLCLFIWVAWKVVAALFVVYFVQYNTTTSLHHDHSAGANMAYLGPSGLRLLYLVTVSADTVNATIWRDAVQTLRILHDVDVVVITDDKSPASTNIVPSLTQAAGVTVIWNDASPYEYISSSSLPSSKSNKLVPGDLFLQHRYVVKDRLPYYDLILSWDAASNVTPVHVAYAQRFATLTTAVPAFTTTQIQLQLLQKNESSTEASIIPGLPSTAVWTAPSSTATSAEGWIMSPAQIWHIIQNDCPSFLPTVAKRPQACTWPMWVDQAAPVWHTVGSGAVSLPPLLDS